MCELKTEFKMNVKKRFSMLLVSTALVLSVSAGDWSNFRGPDYNGIAKEPGLRLDFNSAKPTRLWRSSVSTGFSSLTTSKGRVFTMGHKSGKDSVYCLDAKTGKEVWSMSYPAEIQPNLYEGGPNATPTIHEGLVYIFGKQGQFFCLSEKSGKKVWEVNISQKYGYKAPGWGFTSSPYISNDLVILNAGSGGIAFNRKTGKLVWKSAKGKASYATPVPYKLGSKDSILYFAARSLKCLDPKNGELFWEVKWKTAHDINGADPVIYGKDVFISSGYGRGAGLVKVNGKSASIVWDSKAMRNHFNSSIVIGDYAYGIDGNTGKGDTNLRCIRVKDGKLMWSKETGFGSVTVVNDKLLVLRENGQLLSVDASPKYKENGNVQILGKKCWTSPIVSNGHLFARNAKGDIVCFKLK
jgi:outer membrane protein assembly factor BamB